MILVIAVLEILLLGGLGGYLHVRYAQANYPNSSRWKLTLFLSGFIPGVIGLGTILYQEATTVDLLFFSLLGGVFNGLISLFLFPRNMQRIYPKRADGSK